MLEALNKLIKYGEGHFKYEESVMRAGRFPDIESHINLHDNFYNQIEDYKTQYEEGLITLTEILVFTVNWLQNHILKEDHKFKRYFDETKFIHD